MIAFLCAAVCHGCRAPVNVWKHGDTVVIRDRSAVESPVHLCSDPYKRERVDVTYYEERANESRNPVKWWLIELMHHRCESCGSQDVALSTWGRMIDFPCGDIESEGWAEAWVGPLTEHVCERKPTSAPQHAPRPVWEAYGH